MTRAQPLQPREGEASVSSRYRALVAAGTLADDPAQRALAAAFDRVLSDLREARVARKSSALGWMFAKRRAAANPGGKARGLYVHGSVGRGKTMMMDLFFELVPARRKRRVHFNDFMADVHERIHRHRQRLKAGETKENDPIPPVAATLFEEAWVLCFDEFSVTDITDAMILSRLFSELFARGCVLVATSNVAPENLYRDGLNRSLFLPFVDLLRENVTVFELDAATDYRLEKTSRLPVYLTLDDPETPARMDAAWAEVTAGKTEAPLTLTVKGHPVHVPRAAGTAARFSFAELCERPFGPSDYIAIADRFDTVFVDAVPRLSPADRNAIKRLIALVDTCYDHRIRLFASAATAPEDLLTARQGTEGFEFDRTASRLFEMQSRDYLDQTRASAGDVVAKSS